MIQWYGCTLPTGLSEFSLSFLASSTFKIRLHQTKLAVHVLRWS
jgi:hypothetical protein